MNIDETMIVPMILKCVPSFKDAWNNYLLWDDSPTPCDILMELGFHVKKLVKNNELDEFPALFKLIESFMTEGEKRVATAAATCFLEGLQNANTPSHAWVHLLGKESKDYCLAWDAFTGARTEGLE